MYEGEGVISTFNEAMYQMFRIHEIQSRINICNLEPLKFHILDEGGDGAYGYEIVFNSLTTLFVEASSKLNPDELKEGRNLRNRILNFLRDNKIIETSFNGITKNNVKKINKEEWDELKEDLFDYEIFVRRILEAHNLTSPSSDDDGL